MNGPAAAPPPASFAEAFRFWLKLGFISFGGPAGQIAIMHQELVERRRWISEKRFLHALNYCMLLPGPEAQQLATYMGWLMHRTWGGIVAGGLFILPSVFILIALSWIYLRFGEVPLVAGLFQGVKPAVVAIVAAAAVRIGSRALRRPLHWIIAAAAFAALQFGVPFPAVVLAAALVGLARASEFTMPGGHAAAGAAGAPAWIDDHSAPPPHARFSWRKFTAYVAVALAAWIVSLGLLVTWQGWEGTLAQMAWFFTKAAFLTFGGAYAVLPYVFQGAVEHHQWLTAGQMIDGLALGETTPGPLIMVVAFVGFVGAWTHQVLGESLFLAGAAGALTATWFTFLPSFLFIFAGAPFIETTHGNLRFTAPLAAITAAVVGVILNLAVAFGVQVLWPAGFAGGPDWVAALIGAGALLALVRWKLGVLPVIAAAAAAGLAIALLG